MVFGEESVRRRGTQCGPFVTRVLAAAAGAGVVSWLASAFVGLCVAWVGHEVVLNAGVLTIGTDRKISHQEVWLASHISEPSLQLGFSSSTDPYGSWYFIPLWPIAVLGLFVLTAAWWRHRTGRTRLRACPKCCYDLRGIVQGAPCPECGEQQSAAKI